MAQIKEFSSADLNTISRFGGVSNTLEKINGVTVTADSFTGLLDTYTGAAAAYSVRRLATATTVLLRVRRETAGGTGDDDEADVAYDSNNELSLDSAISNASAGVTATTFGQFVAASGYSNPDSLSGTILAYVDEWYDQSGNSNDATQSTQGSQPQIYNGTAVITENGKPAVYSAGSKNLSTTAVNLGVSGDVDIDFFAAIKNDSANGTSSSGLFGLGVDTTVDSDRRRVYCFGNDSATLKSVRLFGGNTVVTSSATGQVLFNTNYQGGGGAFDVRFDGSSSSVSSFSNTGLNIQQNSIFCLFSANSTDGRTSYLDSAAVGYIQEVVFYLSDQGSTNRTGIESDIMTHFSIT